MGSFNTQNLANTAWAFAQASHLDTQLFTMLARVAQCRVSIFKTQNLFNTAWAFAQAGQLDMHLFTVLAKVAEQRVCDLYADSHVMLWALSRCRRMINAWCLFEHAQRIRSAASLHCFEALLIESERGERYEHEIALLKGLEGAAGNVGAQRGCVAAAE